MAEKEESGMLEMTSFMRRKQLDERQMLVVQNLNTRVETYKHLKEYIVK